MIFTIKQQVMIWQEFEIAAKSKKEAIALLEQDYTANNCEPVGNIDRFDESEVVLKTELHNEQGQKVWEYDAIKND